MSDGDSLVYAEVQAQGAGDQGTDGFSRRICYDDKGTVLNTILLD